MEKKSLDLSQFIPQTDKNPLSVGLFTNIINNHFSNDSTLEDVYGWFGQQNDDSFPYISVDNIDNQLNILEPCLTYTHGSEKHVHTFTDFLKKLKTDGYDIKHLGVDATSDSFTFVLPINYDKFCNYAQYYWYGASTGLTSTYNPNFILPEYITISNGSNANDWTASNFWIHINDIPTNLSASTMTRATRPIIEYDNAIQLNSYYANNKPAIASTLGAISYTQKKNQRNQYPLFDIFSLDGSFTQKTSSIFTYYNDTSDTLFDTELQMYITKSNNIFTFKQHLQQDDILYSFKTNSDYNFVWAKSTTVNYPKYYIDVAGIPQESDPLLDTSNIGWYKFPDDLLNNAEHKIDNVIDFTNIQQHFVEVIKAQIGISGNPYGSNNYRTLTHDKTRGGIIIDTNSDWSTIMPFVLSNDLYSAKSIINFMQKSYMQLLANTHDFIIDNFDTFLTTTNEDIKNLYDDSTFNTNLFNSVKDDLSKSWFSDIFFDTTCGLNFSAITLPYLRVLHTTTPGIKFDDLLNSYAIQHHDGHISKITTIDIDVITKIVRKKVLRSDGNNTGGIIANNPPARPYKNQLWYNTIDNKLYVYNIVSDVFPFTPKASSATVKYYFNRSDNTLFSYDGTSFNTVLDNNAPWVECDIGLIIDNVVLSIEKSLYDGVPTHTQPLKLDFNIEYVANSVQFSNILHNAFLEYCETNNINDPFKNIYVQTDAFTWNYSMSPLISGLTTSHATWQNMYLEYFGTSRPDLFPWILQGYTTKPLWWDSHYSVLAHSVMWNDIVNNSGPFTAPTGPWTKKLAVDINSSTLLPPYVHSGDVNATQALYNMIPLLPYKSLVYGDLGETEITWRKSIVFGYTLLHASYMCNPIRFIKNLISSNNKTLNGYVYDQRKQRKKSFSNNLFFGDTISRNTYSQIRINTLTSNTIAYTLKCLSVGEYGNIFSIVGGVVNTRFTNSYSDANISLSTVTNGTCFFVGDVINISVDGTITYVYTKKFYTNNLLQVLTHYSRDKKYDLKTNRISVLFKSPDLKLCHRNSCLYNTQNLELSTDFVKIPPKSYEVVLKKNKNVTTYTLDTLRVVLKKLGGNQTLNGIRIPIGMAEDWEYQIVKIGGLNKNISYYDFNTSGTYSDFPYRNISFKKYLDKTNVLNVTLPIDVKGLQNVINILNGYAEYTKTVGWEVNASNHLSNIDEITNSIVDWDSEITRVISTQYSNIISGTGVLFNPFRSNVWFNNNYGVVSSFITEGNNKNIECGTYDINGDVIDPSTLNIFRFSDKCQISSLATPMNSIVLSIDTYEHVIIFDDYVGSHTRFNLIYDKKYGTHIKRLKVVTQCSRNNGKPILNGFYLQNGTYKKNIENNIGTIEKLYDIDSYDSDDIFKRVQSLIGYKNRKYLEDLEYTNKTQFNFWRGTLKNKGTQSSIKSFNNSSDFGNDAKIFEYWAYRIASYGDARDKNIQEFYMSNDMLHNNVNIFSFMKDINQTFAGDENIVNDNIALKSVVKTFGITITDSSDLYTIPLNDNIVIYKNGIENPLIENTNYVQYNATTIKFLTANTLDEYKVYYTNPNYGTHNILNLVNNKNENVSYIKAFDPLRNAFNCNTLDRIDVIDEIDPSICNTVINNTAQNIKSFWAKEHVNTIWWNTFGLEYLQYTDEKIYPNRILRHNIWGKLSDSASINIYQWIESPVAPQKYVEYVKSKNGILNNASGVPSIKKLYAQKRNWFVSTIAWMYNENPQNNSVYTYLHDNNTNNIHFEKNVIGDKIDLFIENVSWNDIDLSNGLYISPVNSSGEIQGQVYIQNESNITNICGSSTSTKTPGVISNSSIVITKIEISNTSSIGEYLLSYVNNGSSSWSIVCTCGTTGVSQSLDVLDVANIVGFVIKYDFSVLGVKIFAHTLVDHTHAGFSTAALRKALVASTIGNVLHDLVVRSKTLCTYMTYITNSFVITRWVGYNQPSALELSDDNPYPYNKWKSVESTPIEIIKNGFTFSDIDKGLTFITKNKTLQKYTYTLDEYFDVADTHIVKKYNNVVNFFENNFDINNIFKSDQCIIEVYLNGVRLKSTFEYVVLTGVLHILPNVYLNIGDSIHMIVRKYVPLDNMYDVTALDSSDEYVFTLHYPCTVVDDLTNGNKTSMYYFWAHDVLKGDTNTIGIKEDLVNRNKTYFSIDTLYANQYTNINIHNSYSLTKNNTYTKIGIMNDSSLRDEVDGINFKNKHHEWKLIHPNMSEHISKKLWDSLTYSLAGFDRAGNTIPNQKYIEYDNKNRTLTRFGFDGDKTLIDKNVSLITLKNRVVSLNDWSTLNFIDPLDIDLSFDSAVKIINTMNKIYEITNYKIPNKIFFDLLDDMVALGYHMTELFKTSYIEIEYSQIA